MSECVSVSVCTTQDIKDRRLQQLTVVKMKDPQMVFPEDIETSAATSWTLRPPKTAVGSKRGGAGASPINVVLLGSFYIIPKDPNQLEKVNSVTGAMLKAAHAWIVMRALHFA